MYRKPPNLVIDPKKWYIVDTHKESRVNQVPLLLKKTFDNVKQVKMCLDKYLDSEIRFDYIKGEKAIELGMRIMKRKHNLHKYLTKYCYQKTMITEQDKKSYRTKFRRHHRTKKGHLYKKWG